MAPRVVLPQGGGPESSAPGFGFGPNQLVDGKDIEVRVVAGIDGLGRKMMCLGDMPVCRCHYCCCFRDGAVECCKFCCRLFLYNMIHGVRCRL